MDRDEDTELSSTMAAPSEQPSWNQEDLEEENCESIPMGQITLYPDKFLGRGAFGNVVEGEFDGRRVAVKRVMAGTANVQREVELHRKCDDHPNVVRYLWVEVDNLGDSYLVLQLCLGTLVDYVERTIDVPGFQGMDFLKDATRGLDHLHRQRIVHRDMKPSNVLISLPESGAIRAMIGDFGRSKKLNTGSTSFSISSKNGSHRWMAPEIISGASKATMAIDVYAMGFVYFYVLSEGQLPFDVEDEVLMMNNIKSGKKNLSPIEDDFTASSFQYTQYLGHSMKTIAPTS